MGKIWDKGFEVDKRVEEFTVGNDFLIDMKLINYDCKASIIPVSYTHLTLPTKA